MQGDCQVFLSFIRKTNDVGVNLQEGMFTTKIMFLHFLRKLKDCNSIASQVPSNQEELGR